MRTAVGIFTSFKAAESAVQSLQAQDIPDKNINLLAPGATKEEIDAIETTPEKKADVGRAVGSVVGGATGFLGGMPLGAVGYLFTPYVGPVVAIGVLAGSILSSGGTAAGAAAGEAFADKMTEGLPKDELFVYEDALRQGRTVVIVFVEDETTADIARGIFVQTGAENIDSAREKWWRGLRDVEKERYDAQGGDFTTDEPAYRYGFEAALHPGRRGKSYKEVEAELQERYPDICATEAFRHGYQRGQAYDQALKDKSNA